MVFYRFHTLSQGLKATSAGLFSVNAVPAGRNTVKYVYKPMTSIRVVQPSANASSHGNGDHEHHRRVPKGWEGWENWKTWKDVPDSLIPRTSVIDAGNDVYGTKGYINFRKQQIWSQRPVDTPVYLMYGTYDKVAVWTVYVLTAVMLLITLDGQYRNIYKKYYPDEKLFFIY